LLRGLSRREAESFVGWNYQWSGQIQAQLTNDGAVGAEQWLVTVVLFEARMNPGPVRTV
jgi:hypothetical protein